MKRKLIIRDGLATLSNDEKPEQIEMRSRSLEIVNDDGRTLFEITLNDDASICVRASDFAKVNGKMLDTKLSIFPEVSNSIRIVRPEYR